MSSPAFAFLNEYSVVFNFTDGHCSTVQAEGFTASRARDLMKNWQPKALNSMGALQFSQGSKRIVFFKSYTSCLKHKDTLIAQTQETEMDELEYRAQIVEGQAMALLYESNYVLEESARKRAPKPSWCRTASHIVEKTICRTSSLWWIDKEVNALYRRVKNKAGVKRCFKRILKAAYRCGSNISCIGNTYRQRYGYFSVEAHPDARIYGNFWLPGRLTAHPPNSLHG